MFWHSPILIPLKIFKTLDSVLNTFIWGPSRHKFAWNTLKNPTSSGGAAPPDFHSYYIAAQLSHFYHFHKTDGPRYQALTCNRPNSNTHSPLQVLFRGGGGRRMWRVEIYYLHITNAYGRLTGAEFVHSDTPLWHNPQLRELLSIPGTSIWASKGILYLHQVITPLGVRSFQTLQGEFDLPSYMIFRYAQMHHALQAQFPQSTNINHGRCYNW